MLASLLGLPSEAGQPSTAIDGLSASRDPHDQPPPQARAFATGESGAGHDASYAVSPA